MFIFEILGFQTFGKKTKRGVGERRGQQPGRSHDLSVCDSILIRKHTGGPEQAGSIKAWSPGEV